MLFDVLTPMGFRVRVSSSRWNTIATAKHPRMRGRERDVEEVLRLPLEIRRSRSDPDVYLFYRSEGPSRWVCVVAKRLNGDGFVVTAYPTDAVKEGEQVWSR